MMYRATIIGNLWMSGEGYTNVPIIADTTENAINQVEKWPDFDGVIDYELVHWRECKCCHAETRRDVVRPWTTPRPELALAYE